MKPEEEYREVRGDYATAVAALEEWSYGVLARIPGGQYAAIYCLPPGGNDGVTYGRRAPALHSSGVAYMSTGGYASHPDWIVRVQTPQPSDLVVKAPRT